jgi:hypothetical protein
VFEDRMLRKIFGPKREEVAGGCRSLHNEELQNLCASPNIIKVIKSRRMRWAGTQHAWVEVNLSLCLTKHCALKKYWGVDV